MSIKRAQREIDSREFAEWMAEYSIEPWGELRADLRSGIVAAVIAAAHGAKRAKPGDYMPKFEEGPKRRASGVEIMAKFVAYAEAHNARIKQRGGK